MNADDQTPDTEHAKITAIADLVAKRVRTLIIDHADDLLSAINHTIDQAQQNETEGSYGISFGVKLDWGKNKARVKMTFAQKTSDETEDPIPDPNQPHLPGINDEEET